MAIELTFSDIIERITEKLRDSNDETIADFYNQLFDNQIKPMGDVWEEEIDESEERYPTEIDEDSDYYYDEA